MDDALHASRLNHNTIFFFATAAHSYVYGKSGEKYLFRTTVVQLGLLEFCEVSL